MIKIEYLFTESRDPKKVGSRLIKWGTGKLHPEIQSCSHVALKIGNLVLESTLSNGVDLVPYKYWIKQHKVVHAFLCPASRHPEDIIDKAINVTYNKSYDWFGIMFFSWRMLGFILLNRPLPQINRWHSVSKFFCVEVISAITGENYHMTSPVQLVAKWRKCGVKRLNPDKYVA